MRWLTWRFGVAVFFFAGFLISSQFCRTYACMAVQEKFREHKVVPDVIDEPPAELATVRGCILRSTVNVQTMSFFKKGEI